MNDTDPTLAPAPVLRQPPGDLSPIPAPAERTGDEPARSGLLPLAVGVLGGAALGYHVTGTPGERMAYIGGGAIAGGMLARHLSMPADRSLRRGDWWNPSSWFVPTPDECRARVSEVRGHLDALNVAILSSAEGLGSTWGASWINYAGAAYTWEREARDDLDDLGTSILVGGVLTSATLIRIHREALDKLRELRDWRSQAVDRGLEVSGETPPDLIDLGVFAAPRLAVYGVAGLAAAGVAVAVSREGRAWLGVERRRNGARSWRVRIWDPHYGQRAGAWTVKASTARAAAGKVLRAEYQGGAEVRHWDGEAGTLKITHAGRFADAHFDVQPVRSVRARRRRTGPRN